MSLVRGKKLIPFLLGCVTSRMVTAFNSHKRPDKEGLLKHFLTVFNVTAFRESQNRHK
jgi:hypothetical protein